jgi:hypothetical protein
MRADPYQGDDVAEDPGPESRAIAPSLGATPTDPHALEYAKELEHLLATIAERDRELTTLRSELKAFEVRYRSLVGSRYVEIDRLEADIAGALAALSPDDPELQVRAREARERADASAEAMADDPSDDETACYAPSAGLKQLYRRVAREMHPDRGAGADDSDYRHELMVEANRAYREKNLEMLEALLCEIAMGAEYEDASPGVKSLLRRLGRARRELAIVDEDIEELESGELYALWREVVRTEEAGRDLLKEKVSSLDRRIGRARNRLEVLTQVI